MDFKEKKQQRFGAYVNGALLIAIIIFVNLIGYNVFSRIDLTENKQFTISQATKTVLSNLDDLVTIKVFFTKNLPPHLAAIEKDVKDTLAEFQVYARGNLQVEYIDPADKPELENQLRMYGIPEIQMNVLEKDKVQVIKGYLGIGIFYADKSEALPVVQDLTNFEYDMITSIKKVTSAELKKVGFVAGERDIENEFKPVLEALRKQYEVTKVDLSETKNLDEYETFVVLNVKDLKPYDVFQIDQLIMKGKRFIILDDVFSVGENLSGTFAENPLADLLKFYGVLVEKDLVVDPYCGMASFNQGWMQFTQPYPFFVKVGAEGIDKESPVMSKLSSVLLPWTASLTLMPDNAKDRKLTVLLKSSEKSFTKTGRIDLMPNQRFMPEKASASENLAVMISGQFESFYKGKAVPKKDDKKEGDADKKEGAEVEPAPVVVESTTKENHVLVVGSSEFMKTPHLQQSPTNLMFVNNAVDWMTLDESLIGIRAKAVIDRSIDLAKLGDPNDEAGIDAARERIKYINILLMPFLVILFGIGRHMYRKKSRAA